MIAFIVILVILIFLAGYFFYGRFLSRQLELDDSVTTPACEIDDGVDYVPAKAPLLLGQHFSAIAAAGPIVGPILAGLWFGWAPAILWIIFGAIFIGGVHDFTSLVASVKHKGASVGELVKQYMTPASYVLFLTFVWLALVYVIIAFTDITAQTFTIVSSDGVFGPIVASTSILYLIIGLIMGVLLHKFKASLWATTAVFLPIILAVVWFGAKLPQPITVFLSGISVKSWEVILLIYCFIASIIPMWLLLQPRGYLGGWFLYMTLAIGLLGALFGGFSIQYPAFNLNGLHGLDNGKFIFPILFITIACGACSGFHGIVSSGTTSKQIYRQSDTRRIGYGAMLLEGMVAVLALATVMMISKGDPLLKNDPNFIYAKGIAKYLGMIGIDLNTALAFALLAFSTFVYDTLDVCTRLARYILQELLGWKTKAGAFFSTLITLFVPFVFLMLTKEKGYLVAWPIFGTSNQLLASLILMAVSIWLIKTGRNAVYAIIPMAFMMVVTLWSVVLHILPLAKSLPLILNGTAVKQDIIISGVCGAVLLVLALWLIFEAITTILELSAGAETAAAEN